jgi:choline dehydrogenase
MALVHPHQIRKAYDVIIIGAGSGGCVIARRLVDGSDARILLIEAGSSDYRAASLMDPTAWIPLAGGPYDWGLSYAPNPRLNHRSIPIPRGKVLGGSSAINAMMWYRGHPSDYDAWDVPGWSWEECLPAFKACETWEYGASALRGGDGPLRITRSPDPHPVALAMMEGLVELGYSRLDDPNGSCNDGVGLANFNISGGQRFSSAQGYLEPVLNHPRMTIASGLPAQRLVIEGSRVVGVEVAGVGAIMASHVVLAAGAFETPRLLTLSGLAGSADLKRLGLRQHADLPGVGQNLQDHPLLRAVNFRAKVSSGPTRDNGGGAIANVCSHGDRAKPDVHLLPIQQASGGPDLRAAHDLSGDVFALAPGVMHTRSVGHVRVESPDHTAPMVLDPNFLDHRDDWAAMRFGVRLAVEVAHTKAFGEIFGGMLAPPSVRTDEEVDAFIRAGCSTFFHACGTARMGRQNDPMAVVDERLNVRGVEGLSIADASVIPLIPTCNTHAPVTMIGERAAAFLLEDWSARGFCQRAPHGEVSAA